MLINRPFLKFLSKNKLYTSVTIAGFSLSLTFVLFLGIFIKQELSTDKFHKKKDRIFLLAQDKSMAYFANPVADLIKDNCPEIESFTRIATQKIMVESDPSSKLTAEALFVDSSFFNIFSFRLSFGEASHVLKTKNSAVLSESFAKKVFQDENPIGNSIIVNDSVMLNITGIMKNFPSNTQLPNADILINYQTLDSFWSTPGSSILTEWGVASFVIYFLAKPNTDLPSKSSTVLDLFLKNGFWLYTSGYAKEVIFIPLTDVYLSGVTTAMGIKTTDKTKVLIYAIIALLILITSILNYINLSVAQAGKRITEIAVKKLFGCGNTNIILQFIRESIFITTVSLLVTFVFVFIFKDIFESILNTRFYIINQFTDYFFVVILILGIVIIGIMAGLIPALVISRLNLVDTLKGIYTRKFKSLYSKIFVTFQYFVAFVLFACCAFIIKQTFEMKNHILGFDYKNLYVVTGSVNPENRRGLKSALERISGVEMISFTVGSPFYGFGSTTFISNGVSLRFNFFNADSSFFNILGINVRSTEATINDNSIWINRMGYEALNIDSISHLFSIEEKKYQVLGVIDNITYQPLRYKSGPLIIYPLKTDDEVSTCLLKTSSSINSEIVNKINKTYSEYNATEANVRFADDIIKRWYLEEEKTINIIAAFSVVTFAILLMGIFAMTSYFIQQNKKSIKIRKVIGATRTDILLLCNIISIRDIAIAYFISIPAVLFIMRNWLKNFAYQTSLEWWIFLLIGIIIFAISIISITIQSFKIANTNPINFN